MPKLGKNDIALTAKFDCDRFLRFKLASPSERRSINLQDYINKSKARPGIELVQNAGSRWEIEKYEDLIRVAGEDRVVFDREDDVNEDLKKRRFKEVEIESLFELLCQGEPPLAIIEGSFEVPTSITPGLQKAYDTYNLDKVRARPDILWIRPVSDVESDPISDSPQFDIHVIDVKMAAKPSLRHYVEVTFYALALEEALRSEPELASRYRVHPQGFVWPGTHDANDFSNRFREAQARGRTDPVTAALLETLEPVPYETYHAHVIDFFENRLLKVLSQPLTQTDWHVSIRCQLCDFISYCTEKAGEQEHLCKIAGITAGSVRLLNKQNVSTIDNLITAIATDSQDWQEAKDISPQLRADEQALLAKAQALATDDVVGVPGRRTASMPRYTNMNIALTLHFDPGSGLTFSFGARRVYFPVDQSADTVFDNHAYVVDRATGMDTRHERQRLLEFLRRINGWLNEANDTNRRIVEERKSLGQTTRQANRDFGKVTVHFFFWDKLELTHLKRVIRRHLNHPEVRQELELLARMFPPDDVLPDPDAFKAQPGTVLKEVMVRLVGLPVPHTYTLFDAADTFYPDLRDDGTPYLTRKPYGFYTDMSDQIPFERAYELWEDKVLLRKRSSNPGSKGPLFEREEIRQGIRSATLQRLEIITNTVYRLRQHHGDALMQEKSAFSLADRSPLSNVPTEAHQLMALQLLDVAAGEIEVRANLALPVDEREARFLAIRGLQTIDDPDFVERARAKDARYQTKELRAFIYSPGSRDARMREGDFTLTLSNENSAYEISVPWKKSLGLNYYEAKERLEASGFTGNLHYLINAPLSKLTGVEIVLMESLDEPPRLVLSLNDSLLFSFTVAQGLLDLEAPLAVDSVHADFATKQVKKVLAAVSGRSAS